VSSKNMAYRAESDPTLATGLYGPGLQGGKDYHPSFR
jgi:hypothetical protein